MAASTSPPSRDTPTTSFTSSALPLQQTPQPPSPASLDILPLLTTILTRLQNSQNSQNAQQAGLPAGSPPPEPPIAPKDVIALTDGMKQKLREARAQVAKLPDMEIGLEEQEDIIKELEERIAAQKKELERLRGLGFTHEIGKDSMAMDET